MTAIHVQILKNNYKQGKSICLICIRKSVTFCFVATSNPIVGSSKYTISGFCINIDTISAFILCPKESNRTCCDNNSSIPIVSIKYFDHSSYFLLYYYS
jgi:hypothetical protein